MAADQYDSKSISATTQLKTGHAKLRHVFVTLAGSAGDKVELVDNTSGGTPVILTFQGEAVQQCLFINKVFKDGLRAVVTGTTARYTLVWE